MPYHFQHIDRILTVFNAVNPAEKITANSLLFQFSQFSDALLFQQTVNQLEKNIHSLECAINVSLVVSSTDNKHFVNLFLLPQARIEGGSVYTIISFLKNKNIYLDKVQAYTPDPMNPLSVDPNTGKKNFNITDVFSEQFELLHLDFISFLDAMKATQPYRPLGFRR